MVIRDAPVERFGSKHSVVGLGFAFGGASFFHLCYRGLQNGEYLHWIRLFSLPRFSVCGYLHLSGESLFLGEENGDQASGLFVLGVEWYVC